MTSLAQQLLTVSILSPAKSIVVFSWSRLSAANTKFPVVSRLTAGRRWSVSPAQFFQCVWVGQPARA